MPGTETIVIAAISFAASLTQGLVGFGYGMVAVPLYLSTGLSLPESVILATTTSAVHTGLGTFKLRAQLPWDAVKAAALLRCAGLPIGLATLAYIDTTWPIANTKRLVGVVILIVVAMQLRRVYIRGFTGSRLSAFAAFLASGWMAGSIGMGGPPLVLWVTAQDWRALMTKAFILATFAFSLPLHVALLYWQFPGAFARLSEPFLVSLIAVIGGLTLGLRISQHWSDQKARYVVYCVLIALAIRLLNLGAFFAAGQ